MKKTFFIFSMMSVLSCSKKVECSCTTTSLENGVVIESISYMTEHNEKDDPACRSNGNADSVNGVWVVNRTSCSRIN